MVKIATVTLLIITLVSTGLVAGLGLAAANPLAPPSASDAFGQADGDSAPPIGPLAFMILYNNLLYSC